MILVQYDIESEERHRIDRLRRKIKKLQDLIDMYRRHKLELHPPLIESKMMQIDDVMEREKYYWRQKFLHTYFQILFVGAATLQWGFGDIFADLFI